MKSKSRPVCPKCWPGKYKDENTSDFPGAISNPAKRALENAGITTPKRLAAHTEAQILELHGIGATAIPKLRATLKAHGLSFAKH